MNEAKRTPNIVWELPITAAISKASAAAIFEAIGLSIYALGRKTSSTVASRLLEEDNGTTFLRARRGTEDGTFVLEIVSSQEEASARILWERTSKMVEDVVARQLMSNSAKSNAIKSIDSCQPLMAAASGHVIGPHIDNSTWILNPTTDNIPIQVRSYHSDHPLEVRIKETSLGSGLLNTESMEHITSKWTPIPAKRGDNIRDLISEYIVLVK